MAGSPCQTSIYETSLVDTFRSLKMTIVFRVVTERIIYTKSALQHTRLSEKLVFHIIYKMISWLSFLVSQSVQENKNIQRSPQLVSPLLTLLYSSTLSPLISS